MNEPSLTVHSIIVIELHFQEERALLNAEYSRLSTVRPYGLQVQEAEEAILSTSTCLTDDVYGHNIAAVHKFETAERLLKQIQVKSVDV